MKPRHFIGYWGYQKDGSCVWEVNPKDATPEKLCENGIIAAISAGGFSDCPDAWVKVEGDRLILGRDPFGRVTLYWTQVEQAIWFSSQFQQLLPIVKSPQVSIPALYGYSCFSYVPTPLSPVENIFAIPPGTELIFQGNPLKYTRRRLQEWR